MTGYFGGARDSARLTDMNNIYGQLNLSLGMDGSLPVPENSRTITLSGAIIAYQGYAGKTVLSAIKFEKGGMDPKDDTYYTYIADRKKKQAQLMGYLEEYDTTKLSHIIKFFPQSYAAALIDYSERKIGTLGKKICILVESGTLAPVQDTNTGTLDITSANTTPYVTYCDNTTIGSGTGSNLQTFFMNNSVIYNTGSNALSGGNGG